MAAQTKQVKYNIRRNIIVEKSELLIRPKKKYLCFGEPDPT